MYVRTQYEGCVQRRYSSRDSSAPRCLKFSGMAEKEHNTKKKVPKENVHTKTRKTGSLESEHGMRENVTYQ